MALLQPSGMRPQSLPSAAQVVAVQPQLLASVPPPHESGQRQVPQSSVPPQPSDAGPQLTCRARRRWSACSRTRWPRRRRRSVFGAVQSPQWSVIEQPSEMSPQVLLQRHAARRRAGADAADVGHAGAAAGLPAGAAARHVAVERAAAAVGGRAAVLAHLRARLRRAAADVGGAAAAAGVRQPRTCRSSPSRRSRWRRRRSSCSGRRTRGACSRRRRRCRRRRRSRARCTRRSRACGRSRRRARRSCGPTSLQAIGEQTTPASLSLLPTWQRRSAPQRWPGGHDAVAAAADGAVAELGREDAAGAAASASDGDGDEA